MKKLLVLTALLIATTVTKAEEAAFQLSLTPDIALHSTFTMIRGVSLGLWSENPQRSLTLGVINGSTGESSGVSLAFGLNYSENYRGVQLGCVNVSRSTFTGWQGGAINYSQGQFTGLQTSFLNVAEDVRGVQIGCLNYTAKLEGVQIGFLNIVKDNGWFDQFPNKLATAFPFVNWSF